MSKILHGRHEWISRSFVVVVALSVFVMPNISCVKDRNRYDDELFYKDVAWGIMTGVVTIYNQNIVGTPTGAVDTTASGPFGEGTVHITGTTSYDPGSDIQVVHLQYAMLACRVSSTDSSADLDVDLTLDGVISEDGSWSPTHTSLSYDSDTLYVDGVSRRDSRERKVNGTTTFKANRTSSGTSAELFGFKVSW